ncbi:hypothetical protein E2C01_093152 [Portunus trituberculatus]|uniref:Uncharacterized protein n=1 Tax=Portunus trituberculatus TaxID=210409 RepID=A0A5B7JXC8_PORTR|nr:hypothetical protein [Portunus trituberculatus]
MERGGSCPTFRRASSCNHRRFLRLSGSEMNPEMRGLLFGRPAWMRRAPHGCRAALARQHFSWTVTDAVQVFTPFYGKCDTRSVHLPSSSETRAVMYRAGYLRQVRDKLLGAA